MWGMADPRRRPIVVAVIALAAVWLLAMGALLWARHSKVTAEKVERHLRTGDLERLSPDARAKTLRDLARDLNALPIDERRKVRRDREWQRWFNAMTDEEKTTFVEATLPTGFRQMLTAFEQLPEDKRQQAVNNAMRRLKRAQEEGGAPGLEEDGDRPPPVPLSDELQKKIVKIGLKTFYSESSAQTKAELAPLLEEMQRTMERGGLFRQ